MNLYQPRHLPFFGGGKCGSDSNTNRLRLKAVVSERSAISMKFGKIKKL